MMDGLNSLKESSLELAGKTVLVTGATSGIGFEAAVSLAALGANVVMVARDPKRGEEALARARARSGSSQLSLMLCDFSAQASIRKFAGEFCARHTQLHLLINNAGGVNKRREVTSDGVELTFAVNHLGYFLLTNLLLDLLRRSAPARIVNVASVGHFKAKLDFDNLQFQRGGYSLANAYALSKLANVLFTRELARRLEGSGVTVTALHPGGVRTNIWSALPGYSKPFVAIAKLFFLPALEGAKRVVYVATSRDLEGKSGVYFDEFSEKDPAPAALDDQNAARMWDVSATLTGFST